MYMQLITELQNTWKTKTTEVHEEIDKYTIDKKKK